MTATVPLRDTSAQRRPAADRPRIVLSDTNAVSDTIYGNVRGYTEDGVHTFKGIPYGDTTSAAGRLAALYLPHLIAQRLDHLALAVVFLGGEVALACEVLRRSTLAAAIYASFRRASPGVRCVAFGTCIAEGHGDGA